MDATQEMEMHQPVIVYISASAELAAERDALSRMIAALPVTLVWRIVQTPATDEPLDIAAIQSADVHLLVMGQDIRAPVGRELLVARQARRAVRAFLKKGVIRTPAGQEFIKSAGVRWEPFQDARDLSQQVQQWLVKHLLQNAIAYALTSEEVEQLQEMLAAAETEALTEEGQGADSSAVILSRERFMPSEGVIVEEE